MKRVKMSQGTGFTICFQYRYCNMKSFQIRKLIQQELFCPILQGFCRFTFEKDRVFKLILDFSILEKFKCKNQNQIYYVAFHSLIDLSWLNFGAEIYLKRKFFSSENKQLFILFINTTLKTCFCIIYLLSNLKLG